jgi:hypothetical protein
MGASNLTVASWAYAVDVSSSSPDLTGSGDWTVDATEANVSVNDKLHIRMQVEEAGGMAEASGYWQFYYDTDNTPATATQCTTVDTTIQVVDDDVGTDIADGAATTTTRCASNAGTWQNGQYQDASDDTGSKHQIPVGSYTEMQFHLQFLAAGTYYIFPRVTDTDVVDTYTVVAKIVVTAGGIGSPDINDTSSIAESVTTSLPVTINVNDTSAITENLAYQLGILASATDSISVAESLTVALSMAASVSDSVTVAEDISPQVNDAVAALWYKCNDNAASTTVSDSSGLGRDGTAQQNTDQITTSGKINTALDNNGSSE